ncbi:unnamed protein product [Pleuronectes platessa]|uniref:Uncharacterized protein n=1 Tax=Pleuronectes platessa TaxID=8262 RepID=A0A9N7UL56_PLEPL|nr:unnamed protein product [Pleuronectes platessa]
MDSSSLKSQSIFWTWSRSLLKPPKSLNDPDVFQAAPARPTSVLHTRFPPKEPYLACVPPKAVSGTCLLQVGTPDGISDNSIMRTDNSNDRYLIFIKGADINLNHRQSLIPAITAQRDRNTPPGGLGGGG